ASLPQASGGRKSPGAVRAPQCSPFDHSRRALLLLRSQRRKMESTTAVEIQFEVAAMKRAIILALAAIVFAMPAVALANVGTPLMWASAAHLVLGNAIIGLLEGLLLSGLFKLRAARAIGLMIAANYFSAWVGCAWILGQIQRQFEPDLY